MARPTARPIRKIFQERASSPERKSRLSLSFSWPVLGIMGLVLACAVAWAFFMGFMVGRGQNPETKFREIAGIEQKKEASAPLEEQTPADLPEEPGVGIAYESENPPDTPAAPTQSPENKVAFRVPEGAGLAAWGKPLAEKTPKTAPPAKKAAIAPAQKNGQQFDYTFQVAAFKTIQDAEKSKKNLAAAGIRCKIRKSGKVQLLIASLRGDAAAEKDARQKIKSLKLGDPLLLAKKAVAGGTKKGK